MKAYKYRGIYDRDVLSLENNNFWAPQIKDLNDPCEALVDAEYYKPYIDLIINSLVKNNPQVRDKANLIHKSLEEVLDLFSRLIMLKSTFGVFSG